MVPAKDGRKSFMDHVTLLTAKNTVPNAKQYYPLIHISITHAVDATEINMLIGDAILWWRGSPGYCTLKRRPR